MLSQSNEKRFRFEFSDRYIFILGQYMDFESFFKKSVGIYVRIYAFVNVFSWHLLGEPIALWLIKST